MPDSHAPPSDDTPLPGYARSLLAIEVPVSVSLASKKHPVQEILELVPGAMISFEKSCEQPLQLVIGNRTIAEGEVVKVGDKFGLRIQNIVLPAEHFTAVRPTSPPRPPAPPE